MSNRRLEMLWVILELLRRILLKQKLANLSALKTNKPKLEHKYFTECCFRKKLYHNAVQFLYKAMFDVQRNGSCDK